LGVFDKCTTISQLELCRLFLPDDTVIAGRRKRPRQKLAWAGERERKISWVANQQAATTGGPAPRQGGLRRGKNFGSALLQPSRTLCIYGGTEAGAQCLRLSERFLGAAR